MTDIDRRTAAMLGLFAPFATAALAREPEGMPSTAAPPRAALHDMGMARSSWSQPNEIAMLVYQKMTALDLIGPQYMFGSLMGGRVYLVGKTMEPVLTDTGVTILPTATFAECPKELTVLFTPGGTAGTLAAAEDAETRAFIADRGARATYVTSVCTGSLILGAAGLLKGYRATSHWAARDALAGFGAIPTDQRVVRDRNRITGAGVTAGLDLGLTLVAEMRDPAYAERVQLLCEYDPQPPYHAGSIHTAPAQVRTDMAQMLAGFTAKAHELATSLATHS